MLARVWKSESDPEPGGLGPLGQQSPRDKPILETGGRLYLPVRKWSGTPRSGVSLLARGTARTGWYIIC